MKRLLAPLLLLAACAAPVTAPPPAQPDPRSWYMQAAAGGTAVYAIDPARSLIAVTVRSGGPFARLGHDHVVASRNLTGFAAPGHGRADFSFRLDQMTVDEPALRAQAGLAGTLDQDAIAGTRANMLGRVLEADRYPLVTLRARRLGAGGVLRLDITLHGLTRSIDVPARVDVTPEAVAASGSFVLRQSAFGITPMSVLGGAMVVEDAIGLDFDIHASRLR